MENTDKNEEQKVEETIVLPESVTSENSKENVKKCCGGMCKKDACQCMKKNWRTIAFVVIIIALLGGSYWFKVMKNRVTPEMAKDKMLTFIKENMVAPGTEINVKSFVLENGMYKATLEIQKQEIITYLSIDGTKFFPQAPIDLNAPKQEAAAAPEKKEVPKSDKPTVELFVMSYCPYGLQMERGILPVLEQLGNKIDYKLRFTSYTLHGQKEVDENVRQYCIQKNQPTKLSAYLKCFWDKSTGESTACMKTVGINTLQLNTCVAATNKQYSPTEQSFLIDKELNDKYGVKGSPTLVVNGVNNDVARDSQGILSYICGAFNNPPAECSKALSATSPASGFSDQAQAAGASAASCGS
jgi:thiol-disulfide isomerase/thioredoxin